MVCGVGTSGSTSAGQPAKVCSRVATALAVFEPDKHEVLIVAVEANDFTYAFVWDPDTIAGLERWHIGTGERWIPKQRIHAFSSSAADRSTATDKGRSNQNVLITF